MIKIKYRIESRQRIGNSIVVDVEDVEVEEEVEGCDNGAMRLKTRSQVDASIFIYKNSRSEGH